MISFYNEKELLEKLSSGDKMAFGILYNTYSERLYYFSMHYLNDREASRDILQDVFSEIWEKREKCTEIRNLSSWLFTICKNTCLKKIDHLKVQQKHNDHLKVRQLAIVQNSLNQLDTSPMIFDEINKILNHTLKKLPEKTRIIFELSRFKDKRHSEIADELNISVKSVEAHITKALKVLRIALKNYIPFILFLFR
ncbi:RNA polymerase sigma-70 factor [Thermophagus sp. OGC60D27]|uniref:RNA polymerase sigma-70 factor n=1 Tax=Thermophagus sp. OGC60D27 TaxID=3458415 RepID=UPI0040381D12